MSNQLVLIDGHAMLYRAFYAFPQTLTTRQGQLVNAAYGFTAILLKVIDELKPTHLIVAFDVGLTFRHEEYEQYKAQRAKTPDELKEQEPLTYRVVNTLNMPLYMVEGYEADDVIGTIAARSAHEFGMKALIVTGDMDAMQLVEDANKDTAGIAVYVPGRGGRETIIYDRKAVYDKYGLWPEQIVDYKGLSGDASDNIPGIRGIGPKTATKLLQAFGTIDGIYAYLDEQGWKLDAAAGLSSEQKARGLSASVVQKLLSERESALQSRHLARIVKDVELKYEPDDAKLKQYDKEAAVRLFGELEFTSLIGKLPEDEFESEVQEALF